MSVMKDWMREAADEIGDEVYETSGPGTGISSDEMVAIIVKHAPTCIHEWDALLEYTAPNGPMKVIGPWSCKKCGYTVTTIPDGIAYMPVPRCGSCKHWKEFKNATSMGLCKKVDQLSTPVPADFGCVMWEAK